MDVPGWVWAVTVGVILVMLAVDFLGHARKAHIPSLKESGAWSAAYVLVALAFGVVVWQVWGAEFGQQYFSGYVLEKSLSVDNLFVFVLILSSFRVPRQFQQKVLLVGIVIALALRTVFIFIGAAAVNEFSWIFYIFGAFLIWVAIGQVKRKPEGEEEYQENAFLRLVRRVFRTTDDYVEDKLLVRQQGKVFVTPMLIVMLAIGSADVLFAVDSIPAIFTVTQETYLVFTANAFALLGLRQLYFLIDGLLDRLVYLGYGLAAILGFIGIKLMLHALSQNNLPFIYDGQDVPVHEPSTATSLLVIIGILVVTIIASLTSPRGKALRALQNAEKFAHRYSNLPEDASAEDRRAAAEKMDYWTHRAEEVEHRYLNELIEHKDQWSGIIRAAHETRLEDANRRGIPALTSQKIVSTSGPVLAPDTNGKWSDSSESKDQS